MPPDGGGFMWQLECNFLGPMSNQPTSCPQLGELSTKIK
ncbi:unnamed protein product [Musa textilis]